MRTLTESCETSRDVVQTVFELLERGVEQITIAPSVNGGGFTVAYVILQPKSAA